MAERQLIIRLLGDSTSLERAFARSAKAGTHFDVAMKGIGRNAFGFTRGFASGAGALSKFGGALALTSGSFFAGAGLVAGLKASVGAAGDFQQTLNVLQQVSGATTKQLAAASAEARKLGADISLPATSALDAAQAMEQLAKGGLTVSQTIAATRGTLQLAAAAQTDVATAANTTARALTAFGLSGGAAGAVADALANAANAATGDITDFAIGLSQSATSAHQFGLSAQDTVAALTELAQAGILGSDAGTSLRVMLSRLIPTSKTAKEEIKRLGVHVADAHGKFLPFRDIVNQYATALNKLTPAQRQTALLTIFGTDAQRAANIILQGGVDRYDKLHAAVTRQGGAAKAAAAQQKGFKGALDGFNSALQTTEVTIGTALLPVLTKYLRQAATWLGGSKNQEKIQRDVTEAVKRTVAALKEITGVIRTASGLVGGFKNLLIVIALLRFRTKLVEFADSITQMGNQAKIASGKVETLRGKLVGIGAITIAPIVIPIVIDLDKKLRDKGVLGKILSDFALPSQAVGDLIDLMQANARSVNAPGKDVNEKPRAAGGAAAEAAVKAARAAGVKAAATQTAAAKAFLTALKTHTKGITASQRNTFFDNAISRMLDRVQDLSLKQQLSRLGEISALISQRIAATKDITRKLNLEDQLVAVGRQAKDVRAQIAQDLKDRLASQKARLEEIAATRLAQRTSRQFRELGLSATGDAITPGVAGLRKRLGQLTGNIAGTALDTPKLRTQLARFRKVLSEGLVPKDVRAKIAQMMDDIASELKNSGARNLTKFRHVNSNLVLAGLGLSPEQLRVLRGRISQIGAGGTVPGSRSLAFSGAGANNIVVPVTVNVDGKPISKTVTRQQAKDSKRRTASRRGTYAGRH